MLNLLKSGSKCRRADWDNKVIHIGLLIPDEFNHMTLPFMYLKNVNNQLVPWLPSQADIFAEDWEVALSI